MNHRVIFKHYLSIALVGGAVAISAVLLFTTEDRVPLMGSILVAVLGFCYFVQQQKLAETSLFKDLFTEFNRRYDDLNDRLVQIVNSGEPLDVAGRQTIVDYFNLCAEEYLFFSEGYIHHEAWRAWCAGMLWYFDRQPFQSVWSEESPTNSYYGLTLDAIRRGVA